MITKPCKQNLKLSIDTMVTISNNLINDQALTIKSSNAVTSLLKVGQTPTANVQPISNNQAQIPIGKQTLLANTRTPIQIVERYKSELIRLNLIYNSQSTLHELNQIIVELANRLFRLPTGNLFPIKRL